MQEIGLSPRELLRVFFRHRKKALAVFLLISAAGVAWIMLRPQAFESVAKLYVRIGRETVTLDPTATTGETVHVRQSHETEINTILEILNSRQVAELVVEDLGAENLLEPQATNTTNSADSKLSPPSSIEASLTKLTGLIRSTREIVSRTVATDERSRAIKRVLDSTVSSAPKESSVVTLRSTASHPELARQITDTWTDAFFQEHLRLTRTQGSYEFFDGQVRAIRNDLADAERQLNEIKSTAGLVSVAGQQQILEREMDSIRTRRLVNNSSLAASNAKIEALRRRIGELEPQPTTEQESSVSNDTWDRMRERLYELQIQERELKAKFFPNHPDVVAVEKQRQEVEQILRSQSDTRLLRQSILDEEVSIASYTAEREVLEQAQRSAAEELRTLNTDSMRIADLERQIGILETNYRSHVDKLEQARIHHSLDDERISSVNILQPASLNVQPIGLSNQKCLLLTLILACMGGVGITMLAEYFDHSFATSAQVERRLQLPVLVSIPRSKSPRIRVR